MQILEIVLTLALAGPWMVLCAALGVFASYVAWTQLPEGVDRASICALILIASVVVGGVLNGALKKP